MVGDVSLDNLYRRIIQTAICIKQCLYYLIEEITSIEFVQYVSTF